MLLMRTYIGMAWHKLDPYIMMVKIMTLACRDSKCQAVLDFFVCVHAYCIFIFRYFSV